MTLALLVGGQPVAAQDAQKASSTPPRLDWRRLPDLPDKLGVAGPFVGVHNGALIVAGGANFPRPVWEHDKLWRDRVYALTETAGGMSWREAGVLPRPLAYGAAVSTPQGIVCMGGNDAQATFREVFLLRWDPAAAKVTRVNYPALPEPCAYGQATLVGGVIYLAGGQRGGQLGSAMQNFWSLDLGNRDDPARFLWRKRTPCPGGPRAFNITASQHNGSDECIYVMSGRRQTAARVAFLRDVWSFNVDRQTWSRCADVPRCVMAGTGVGIGKSQLIVLGGADGSLFDQADALRDKHPGFPKEALAYHTPSDSWRSAGPIPQNQVTTIPVAIGHQIIIASGEVRPRVRSAAVWSITPTPPSGGGAGEPR